VHNEVGRSLKVLVLGFDGASPRLINKWIDYLPTFKKFKEHGILGQTIPPIPAQTPVAWTTFMTGKNPGKHGIFSFAMRKKGTYEGEIISPQMNRAKTLWKILSEQGKKVGITNVPMSDTEDIRGFIIPGFLSRSEGIAYPDNIQDKIRRKLGVDKLVGDAEIEILNKVKSEPDSFFERINQITDQTVEVSQYLFQEEDWDFFMTVFMGTDRIQHFFWRHVDDTHQKYEKNRFTDLVRNYYIKIDGIVKSFLNSIDEDTLVIVISDHGFCPVHKEIVVNNYLEELGFLKAKDGKIDLRNSRAVSYGYGDIWLNVKGREPHGLINLGEEYEAIRNKIIYKLKKIEISGEIPWKDVKKRGEIYWGNFLRHAPDLLIIFNSGWQAARHPETMTTKKSNGYVNSNPRWSGGHDGTHDPLDVPGIIGVLGPGIQSSQELQIPLWDVAPTILNLMGVPIPTDMDGKPFLPGVKKKAHSL